MSSVVGLTEILNVTVTPAPGSVQDTNLTKVAGNAVDTGVGASGAGTQRVALSTDSQVKIADGSTAPITGSATGNGVLISTETLGYNSISVQLSGFWTANIVFQASNDNVNWVNVQGYAQNSSVVATDTSVDNDIYVFPVIGRYFQALVTNYTAGPVVATAYLRSQSLAGIGEASLTQAMDAETGTPIQTTFAGIQGPGQQPAANSMPVALANEDIRDLYIASRSIGTPLAVNTVIPMDGAYPIATNPGGWIDVSQYRSIYVSMVCSGTLTGTITIEVSNDGVNLLLAPGYNFFDTQIQDSQPYGPITGAMTLGTNKVATRVGNLGWRYVRFRITTALAGTGTVTVTAMLRMALSPYNTSQVNLAGIGGQGYGTSGSNANANMNPMVIGGIDKSVVRPEFLGAPSALLTTQYTAGPYFRNAYTDLAGNMGVAGPQPFLAEDKTYPVNVRLERTTSGQESVQDLLQQILVELKAMNYYTRELPMAIAAMSQTPNPSAFGPPTSMADDPENFFNDPTLFQYRKGN